ncbi:MAG: response regulator transcription factor [Flavobacteriia bacterium]|nr:response regulator transcription factor [Flavobacteriia bacterium]
MKKIKVAIADDQSLFRKGVVSLLRDTDHIKVVIEVEDGQELLNALEQKKNNLPDIIFMDIRMPKLDGFRATEIITKLYPSIKIIALSMFNTDDHVIEMHRLGSHGFLTKDSVLEDLLDAVDMVMAKGSYYNARTSAILIENAEKKIKSSANNLVKNIISSRELDVIRLICLEKTNYEIADELGLSVRTVEWHKKNIFKKIQVKSTIGLMKYSLENGLI